MIVSCTSCGAEYRIDDSKIPASGGVVSCKTCKNKIKIPPKGAAADAAASPAAGAPAAKPAAAAKPAPVSFAVPASKPPSFDATAGAAGPGPTASSATDPAVVLPSSAASRAAAAATPAPVPPAVNREAPPVADPLADLPPPAPTRPVPSFLDDLPPAPAAIASAIPSTPPPPLDGPGTPSMLDDLPAPATPTVTRTDDRPAPASMAAAGAGDLPAPALAERSPPARPPEDLPTPAARPPEDLPTPAARPPEDLPTPYAKRAAASEFASDPTKELRAPSLMDDLPVPSASGQADPFSGPGGTDPFAGVSPGEPVRASEPASAAATEAAQPKRAPVDPARRKKLIAIAGGGVATVTLGALLFFVVLPALWRSGEPGPSPTPAAAVEPAPPTEPGAGPTPTPATPVAPPAEPVAPTPPPTPALTAANADRAGCAVLRQGVETLTAPEQKELELWARYRLATACGDEATRETLVAEVASPPTADAGALTAAVHVWALAAAGKVPMARKQAERLRKQMPESAAVALVAGQVFADMPPKALKHLDTALELAPDWLDAHIARAATVARTKKPVDAAPIAGLSDEYPDLDSRVRIAGALLDARGFASLSPLVEALPPLEAVDDVAPARRDLFLELLVRRHLTKGDLAGAVAAAEKRLQGPAATAEAAIERARLETFNGGDGVKMLDAAMPRFGDEGDRARLLLEKVRLLLARNDTAAARAARQAFGTGGKDAAGWLKLADGMILEREGKVPAAKAAYTAAAKGRPTFAEPKLALALSAGGPKPQQLVRVTQVARATRLPAAMYALAQLMKERGNAGGAFELFEAVLWTDPTLGDPIALVLDWVVLLDQNGGSITARQLAESIHGNRPDDPRPIQALIAMAVRNKQVDEITRWYELLAKREPTKHEHKLALAGSLCDADKHAEARTVIDALVRDNKPLEKDPEVLYTQGRAWAPVDPIKARSFLVEAKLTKPAARTFLLLGSIDEQRGKVDEAAESYAEAVKLDPTGMAARVRLAAVALRKGNAEDAERQLRVLVNRDPENVEAAEMLGDALRDLDRGREALGQYTKALNAGGENPGLLMKVARLQIQDLGQLQPGVRTLRRAIKLDPKNPEAYYLLGFGLKDLGKTDEARQALQTYLEVVPAGTDGIDQVKSELESLQ